MASDRYRDRIVGQKVVKLAELKPHPSNWRTHSELQASSLDALLANVGTVQTVVWNKRTGHVIDGHLRRELAERRGENELKVTVVDLDEDEERIVLATFDPMGAMAGTDESVFRTLVGEIENRDQWLADLLASTSSAMHIDLTPPPQPQADEDDVPEPPKVPVTRPGDLWLLGGTVQCPRCKKHHPVEKVVRPA